ncbi:zinc finger Y-chromosomal protein 2-like [Amblyomma americanum]
MAEKELQEGTSERGVVQTHNMAECRPLGLQHHGPHPGLSKCGRDLGATGKSKAQRDCSPPGALDSQLLVYGHPDQREEGENTKSAPVPAFPCETCGDQFSAQELLERHRQSSHSQKLKGSYSCRYCPYSSNNKSNVTKHQRTHTGERTFVCKECGKAVARRDHLTSHLLTHSKKRPHECTDCGQRFKRASDMTRHRQMRHSSGGRFASLVCRFCGKRFYNLGLLNQHILTHTGEKPHACSHCGRRFATRSNKTRHERVVHSRQYTLHCTHCGQGFGDVTHLRIHVQRCHSSAEKEEPQYSED